MALYILGRVRLGYSGIRISSGIYSGYSAPGSRIAGMEIRVFRNENSSQTNAYSHYSNYSYSGLIPNERALVIFLVSKTLTSPHVLNINDISLVFLCFIKSLFFWSVAQGFPATFFPNMLQE